MSVRGNLPIQYKCGVAQFCEMPFFVNKSVLIPRFDTELLVETVIMNVPQGARVWDLCTGSGCVAVVLARHGFAVAGVDVSRGALRVSRRNNKLNGTGAVFVRGDVTKRGFAGAGDVVVCNPPYVKTDEIGKWDATTLHEPRIALDGGADGLQFYREIIVRNSGNADNTGAGEFFFEIDYRAGEDVKKLLQNAGYNNITIYKDARGHDRVIHGKRIF